MKLVVARNRSFARQWNFRYSKYLQRDNWPSLSRVYGNFDSLDATILGSAHRAYIAGTPDKFTKQAQVLSQMIEVGWGKEAGAFRGVFANLLMPEGGKEQLKWIGDLQRRSGSPETACQLWNAFQAFDIRAEAGKVTAPTLVLHARRDAMVPFEAGRLVAASIPNARFVPLESKNHILLPREKAWEMFRKEVDDFLDADEHVDAVTDGGLSGLTERERELLDAI